MNCHYCNLWNKEEAKLGRFACDAKLADMIDTACLMKHYIVVSTALLEAIRISEVERRHLQEYRARMENLLGKLENRLD
jgi:hypothetical protein